MINDLISIIVDEIKSIKNVYAKSDCYFNNGFYIYSNDVDKLMSDTPIFTVAAFKDNIIVIPSDKHINPYSCYRKGEFYINYGDFADTYEFIGMILSKYFYD